MLQKPIIIESNALRPKWLRIARACEVYSIGITRFYELLNAGVLETAVLKDKGKKKGLRLVSVESLDRYFSGHASTEWKPMVGSNAAIKKHQENARARHALKRTGEPKARKKHSAKAKETEVA